MVGQHGSHALLLVQMLCAALAGFDLLYTPVMAALISATATRAHEICTTHSGPHLLQLHPVSRTTPHSRTSPHTVLVFVVVFAHGKRV